MLPLRQRHTTMHLHLHWRIYDLRWILLLYQSQPGIISFNNKGAENSSYEYAYNNIYYQNEFADCDMVLRLECNINIMFVKRLAVILINNQADFDPFLAHFVEQNLAPNFSKP